MVTGARLMRLVVAVAVLTVAATAAASSTETEAATSLPFRSIVPALARDDGAAPPAPECQAPAAGGVALLVQPALLAGIRSGLDEFKLDFCRRGIGVIERADDFASPLELRAYLRERRAAQGIVGAILVGRFPAVYQQVTLVSANPAFPNVVEEALSLQFYSDLDGTFSASPAYHSTGAHPFSFDVHGGNVDWEIWTSVIPYYGRSDAEAIANINRYFAKHHQYLSSGSVLPRRFLEVSEFFTATTQAEFNQVKGWLTDGTYAWTPFSLNNPLLYFDAAAFGPNVDSGYTALSQGKADFAVLDGHGYWGAQGRLDLARIRRDGVRAYFVWANGCATGDIAQPENVMSELLFSDKSLVLVAKGTTNDSGGLGNNANGFFGHNIATALAGGATFGTAIVGHVNVPLIYPWSDSREFHLATSITLGDPTLRLPGY